MHRHPEAERIEGRRPGRNRGGDLGEDEDGVDGDDEELRDAKGEDPPLPDAHLLIDDPQDKAAGHNDRHGRGDVDEDELERRGLGLDPAPRPPVLEGRADEERDRRGQARPAEGGSDARHNGPLDARPRHRLGELGHRNDEEQDDVEDLDGAAEELVRREGGVAHDVRDGAVLRREVVHLQSRAKDVVDAQAREEDGGNPVPEVVKPVRGVLHQHNDDVAAEN